MTSDPGKTVALVDPLWIGHHPMYFAQFTAAFLRLGARVIGLCPAPDLALRDLREIVDSATLRDRVSLHHLPAGKRSFFRGRFEGDPLRTFQRWRGAATALADAESATGWRADLAYFPYLDSYLRFLPISALPGLVLRRPWAGLYLRNHHHGEPPGLRTSLRLLGKGDAILRSSDCIGVGVLDERFIPEMERFLGTSITPYPDVAQGNLPDRPFPPAGEIRRKAAGRKIVGMIGLERRKGFLTLLRTARLAAEQSLPYYFACAGVVVLRQYSPAEQQEIQDLLDGIASGGIDNVWFDPATGRIDDEADYNDLFSAFDIAWAAYEGFQGSSGALGKAAIFEIPCIATAGECVGRRIETYRTGITIPEGSATAALAAIPLLAAGTDAAGRPLNPRYADYRADHSQDRLDRILGDLLQGLP